VSRIIVAAWLPFFNAATYRTHHQIPDEQPLLIATSRMVAACDARAAKAGVLPRMPTRQARILCPSAVVISPDKTLEETALQSRLTALAAITPLLEYEEMGDPKRIDPMQAGVFTFDLETLRSAEARKLAKHMRDQLHKLSPAYGMGLAGSKFTAFAAATQGKDLLTITDASAFLAPLPIGLLPLDAAWERRLRLLGLTTLGQFAALPLDAVYRQFGKRGLFLRQLAAGFDLRAVKPFQPQLVEQVCQTLDYPVRQRAVFDALLTALASDLSARLQQRGLMGRTLRLALTGENGKRRERRLTMQREVSGVVFMDKALRVLVEAFQPFGEGITAIDLTLTDLVPFAGYQLDLFDHRGAQWERLTQAVEKLSARYGRDAFTRPVERDRTARLIERRYGFQPFLMT
jgi:nucleotidyltransferase/DNA polymerase involved in DNA repair